MRYQDNLETLNYQLRGVNQIHVLSGQRLMRVSEPARTRPRQRKRRGRLRADMLSRMDILAWSDWEGVQGIASVVSALAIVFVIVDFVLIRIDRQPGFHIKVTKTGLAASDTETISVSARATTDTVAYEAHICEWTDQGFKAYERTPKIDATDGAIVPLVEIPKDALDGAKVGVSYLRVRRTRVERSAVRVLAKRGTVANPIEVWTTYRWPRLPFRPPGQWKSHPTETKRPNLVSEPA